MVERELAMVERELAMVERELAMVEREVTARATAGLPATRGAEALVSILRVRAAAALGAVALGGVVIPLLARSWESPMKINVAAQASRRKTNSQEARQEDIITRY